MMDDEHLIGYCEIHCKTERALFSDTHINRMIALAGYPQGFPKIVTGWYSMHEEMQELCDLAKDRQKQSAPEGGDKL